MKDTLSFAGQTAVITGSGQGIGFAIAQLLGLRGAAVVLNDIDENQLSTAVNELHAAGATCTGVPGDAADLNCINQLMQTASDQFGSVTIAIANAGLTAFGNFFDYKPEILQRVLQVNLSGSFFLAQAAARKMREHGEGGSILLMSSVTGHQAHKDLAAYGMTKAALEMLAKALVIDLSQYKVNINAIAPGATITERTKQDKSYEKVWAELTPMGRAAEVHDIAEAALFLVSPMARHITGQTLVVDGGWTCVSPSP